MTCIRHIFLKRAFMASMLLWASIVVTPAMAASIQYSFTGSSHSPGRCIPANRYCEGFDSEVSEGSTTMCVRRVDRHQAFHGLGGIKC